MLMPTMYAIHAILYPINHLILLQLEYDTERAGTFEPLTFPPLQKSLALGLFSKKTRTHVFWGVSVKCTKYHLDVFV